MFGGLTKLFDRNFAIGYFLPAVIFIGVTVWFIWTLAPSDSIEAKQGTESASAHAVPVSPGIGNSTAGSDDFHTIARTNYSRFHSFISSLIKEHSVTVLSFTGVFGWLFGVWLLAANKVIIRLKEGYGWWSPLWAPFLKWQKYRFRTNEKYIQRLRRKIQQCDDQEAQGRLNRQNRDFKIHFPTKETRVLPFAFGNTMRSFEDYPQTMYGFAGVLGWNRLLGVIPEPYKEVLDGVRAQMDFMVNMWFLCLAFLIECVVLSWAAGVGFGFWWWPTVALLIAVFASYGSRQAAADWGEMIRAAFDLYLSDLCDQLGLERTASREEERRRWRAFSRAIRYHRPECLPPLASPKQPSGRPPGSGRPMSVLVDQNSELPPPQTH